MKFLLVAYLNMISQVIIGNVIFPDIESFRVKESIKAISPAATVIIPRHYSVINGKPVLDYINTNDTIEILAGYNGRLRTIYTGYISEIGADVPVEITCDKLYLYRQNTIHKSYRNVTLRGLLEEHFKGLRFDCPDVTLGKYLIENVSSYQLLEKLRNDFGFYTHMYRNPSTGAEILHVQWAYDWQPGYTKKHTYTIRENVKSNGLKWSNKQDFDTKINLTVIYPDGSKKVIKNGVTLTKQNRQTVNAANEGLGGATTNLTVYNVTEAQAKQIGESRLQQIAYEGYKGSITGFGIPRVHCGDSLLIVDAEQPERQGTYLVEEVEISYGPDGYQRSCKLAFKVAA